MNEPIFDLPPSPEEEPRSCMATGLYVVLVSAIVVGMLSAGIGGVYWLYIERRASTAAIPAPEPTAVSPASTSSPSPTPAPLFNRIVFINPQGGVETIAPDGADRRALTDGERSFQFPAWSPVDEKVAAIGSADGAAVVQIMEDSAQAEPQTIYSSADNPPIYLYWSPNGEKIGFISSQDSELSFFLGSVEELETELRLTGSPFYWDWSPTSEQILAHTGFSGPGARLALLDAAGSRPEIDIAPPGFFQAPAFSRNGRYLAYAEEKTGGLSWLVVTDTEPPDLAARQIEERHAGQVAMGWSPTADLLAFSSAKEGSRGFFGPLRLLDAETGTTTLLSSRTTLAFFWSPDGRYLAVINVHNENDGINVAAPSSKGVAGKRTAQHEGLLFDLALIEVENGRRSHLLTFQPTEMFTRQFLPYFDQYARSHRLWSPDSAFLTLPFRVDDLNQIIVVPVDGSPMQTLAEGDMPFWSWR